MAILRYVYIRMWVRLLPVIQGAILRFQTRNLAAAAASEEDKIRAMMWQSSRALNYGNYR